MSNFEHIGNRICNLFGVPSEAMIKQADIQHVELEIVQLYRSKHMAAQEQMKCLLRLRKSMLDDWARVHEKELLPVIKEFNVAVESALKDVYDLAHRYYDYMASFDSGIQLEARLQFTSLYPPLQPDQSADRKSIWKSLLDFGWNPLFPSGLTMEPLTFPYDEHKSFQVFAGTSEATQNAWWRGGGFFEAAQDEEMKEFRFNSVFYHLAEHTCFALTDFMYVRDFEPSIEIHAGEKKSYSGLLHNSISVKS